jgi:hypothetical protein
MSYDWRRLCIQSGNMCSRNSGKQGSNTQQCDRRFAMTNTGESEKREPECGQQILPFSISGPMQERPFLISLLAILQEILRLPHTQKRSTLSHSSSSLVPSRIFKAIYKRLISEFPKTRRFRGVAGSRWTGPICRRSSDTGAGGPFPHLGSDNVLT